MALALATAVALGLLACGGSSTPRASSVGGAAAAAGGAVPAAGSGYRWLVRTAGRPPSIAEENRAEGSTAYRLPGPASLLGGEATGRVEGYVAQQAIAPGERQSIYVNAPGSRTVTISLYRMGWYGGTGGRHVLQSVSLPAEQQPACAHSSATGLTECGWHPTLSFAIPTALPSGVYVVALSASSGARRDCMFVVRDARPPALLVQIPTATYEAYNAWGGNSLYPGEGPTVGLTGGTRAVAVSYDRPYDSQTGAGQFFIREVAIVRFLERHGYPAGYTTDASIDREPAQLRGVRAVMDVGHSEYWSERQVHALERARDRGTSLIFLSSDTMSWRVRYGPASAGSVAHADGHTIVAYKESAALDPLRPGSSGHFPGGGAALTGSAYDGCITPRLRVPGPPIYRYYSWRAAPALKPVWLFAGTGVSAATDIPGIVGYELDERSSGTPAGTRLLGDSVAVPCMTGSEPSIFHGHTAETTLYTATARVPPVSPTVGPSPG